MKYVFGPVPSRRLGRSLGIDTVPLKTCNWNCVYCQLGRSEPIVHARREHLPREDILAEVIEALAAHPAGEIDWVTFVASGETTLHRGIGWLIRQVSAITTLPIAVITNGSLLHRSDVRQELTAADAVLPTLDAGTEELYRRMNRAHPALSFERHVSGLRSFRREYAGKLWIEVMLVRGLNDTAEALGDLREVLLRVEPDEVHLLLPDRPPAETWVHPPDEEGLMRATAILGEIARVVPPIEGAFHVTTRESAREAAIGIIVRHPMSQEQLEQTLARWTPEEIERAVAGLEAEGRVQVVYRYGVRFLVASGSHFPDDREIRGAHRHPHSRGA